MSSSLKDIKVQHPAGSHPLDYITEVQKKRKDALEAEALELLEEEKAIELRRLDDERRKIEIKKLRKDKAKEVQEVESQFSNFDEEKVILKTEEEHIMELIDHFMTRKTLAGKREFCRQISELYDPLWTLEYWTEVQKNCMGENDVSVVQILVPDKKPAPKKKVQPPPAPKSFFDMMCCTSIPEEQIKVIEEAQEPTIVPRHGERSVVQSRINIVKEN